MAEVEQYDGTTRLKSVLQEAVLDKILGGTFQTDAYIEVYKTCKSRKVAEAAVSRLLSNVKVKARLEYKRESLAKKCDVTAERVVAELAKVGFSNIKDFIESDNNIKDMSALPRDLTAAVESVQTDIRHDSGKSDGYTEKVKFKLYSKLGALDQLGRHLGLFEKDKPAETNITINILNYNGNNDTI